MKIRIFSFLTSVALVLMTGCSDGDDFSSGTGKMSIQLTDAPFPHDLVAEANVTVFKVDARNKNPESDSTAEDENYMESTSPFVVLMEREVQVNLLDLTNGVTETLVQTEVPVGTYDLVRVYVKGINVVLKDGTTYDLKVPSGEQTGIKVFIKPGIEVKGGLSADLLLDFDVSRSFVVKGNSQSLEGITGFNFKPVIKASNLSTAGTLMGQISTTEEKMALEGAQISVFAADTLNTTVFSDATGGYMVMGLDEGSYDIEVELEDYTSENIENIAITAANTTIQDVELVMDEVEMQTGGE